MKKKAILYDLIEIRYADPICSLCLTDRQLLLGSMMGRASMYLIPEKKFILLTEQSSENISGLSIIDKETFVISIGDEEVMEYTMGENSFPKQQRYFNYEIENEHKNKCDHTYTIMNNGMLLLLVLNIGANDDDKHITSALCDYTLKKFPNNTIIETAQIEMTNYSVPFDLSDDQLAFVEFLSDKERNIVLFDFTVKNKKFETLNKAYGHISFYKILNDKRLLIVRLYNVIEILTNDFQSVTKVTHIKGEIIACDWIIGSKGNLILAILDLEANVSFYQEDNGAIVFLHSFNLFDMSDIKQEFKDKLFFSMGYPYYIKINQTIALITTDNGCLVIEHNLEL